MKSRQGSFQAPLSEEMVAPQPQRLKRGTKFWEESLAVRLWTWTFWDDDKEVSRQISSRRLERGSEPGSGDQTTA